jgi:hypothetical protein
MGFWQGLIGLEFIETKKVGIDYSFCAASFFPKAIPKVLSQRSEFRAAHSI